MIMLQTDQIWLKLGASLREFILSRVHDKHVAEDILQEVFIRIHEKIDTLRDEEKITSWIYQITRNLITDYFRKNKSVTVIPGKEEEGDDDKTDFAVMETAVNDMISMLDELPQSYCEALCMTEIKGLSQAEYARLAGIPYSSVKSRIQRSRKMLRDLLMKCCHYQFDRYGTVLNIRQHKCCCCNHK